MLISFLIVMRIYLAPFDKIVQQTLEGIETADISRLNSATETLLVKSEELVRGRFGFGATWHSV